MSLNNFGLSNESGKFEYKDYGENSGVNSLIIDADFPITESPVIVKAQVETGDDYCKRSNIKEIDILKIDVEGGTSCIKRFF